MWGWPPGWPGQPASGMALWSLADWPPLPPRHQQKSRRQAGHILLDCMWPPVLITVALDPAAPGNLKWVLLMEQMTSLESLCWVTSCQLSRLSSDAVFTVKPSLILRFPFLPVSSLCFRPWVSSHSFLLCISVHCLPVCLHLWAINSTALFTVLALCRCPLYAFGLK